MNNVLNLRKFVFVVPPDLTKNWKQEKQLTVTVHYDWVSRGFGNLLSVEFEGTTAAYISDFPEFYGQIIAAINNNAKNVSTGYQYDQEAIDAMRDAVNL